MFPSLLELVWRNPSPVVSPPLYSTFFFCLPSLPFRPVHHITLTLTAPERDSCGRHYAKLCVRKWQRKTKKKGEWEDAGVRVGWGVRVREREHSTQRQHGLLNFCRLICTCFYSQHLHLIGKQPLYSPFNICPADLRRLISEGKRCGGGGGLPFLFYSLQRIVILLHLNIWPELRDISLPVHWTVWVVGWQLMAGVQPWCLSLWLFHHNLRGHFTHIFKIAYSSY